MRLPCPKIQYVPEVRESQGAGREWVARASRPDFVGERPAPAHGQSLS